MKASEGQYKPTHEQWQKYFEAEEQGLVELVDLLTTTGSSRSRLSISSWQIVETKELIIVSRMKALKNLKADYPSHDKTKKVILFQVHPSHIKSYLLLGDIELTEKANIKLAKQILKKR
ncbi:putative smile protein [Schistosoma mansoni]|uniref:putative smile protein n=1 Tax=Schistosoma mansoni TaxID=6183 RepID=UPI00022DCC57|nr:putative smile protein [Schistosoma mansoni]|eukprot:XP_018654352.1 putative smile protein [Schistosoma mansoni]